MQGGTDQASVPVDPRQWRTRGRETEELSVEEAIPSVCKRQGRVQSWQLLSWALRGCIGVNQIKLWGEEADTGEGPRA